MKRLYTATCYLIESAAKYLNVQAASSKELPEQQPEGSFSETERSGAPEPDELHADGWRLARAGFTGGAR